MATCAACGTTILFGGSEVEGRRVCSAACSGALAESIAKETISETAAHDRAQAIRTGACPKCGGVGQTIEIQQAWRCMSFLVMTRRSQRALLACHACGNKLRLQESLLTLLIGWWGFPWGLIFTPLQIGRNISAMFATPSTGPSPELISTARGILAREQGKLSA